MQTLPQPPNRSQTQADHRSLRSTSPVDPGHPPAGTQPTVGSGGLPGPVTVGWAPGATPLHPALGGGLRGPGGACHPAVSSHDPPELVHAFQVVGAAARAAERGSEPRNLDTLRSSLQARETAPESLALAPAGQLVLPGHPAQLGFDRAPYSPTVGPWVPEPGPALVVPLLAPVVDRAREPDTYPEPSIGAELPNVRAADRRQLAFEFASEGVQLGFADWRAEVGRCLRWLSPEERARAERVAQCGRMWQVHHCGTCGLHDTKKPVRSADCDSRVCPSCARTRAREREQFLRDAVKTWPYQRRGDSWWLHTITTVKAPGRSIRAISDDFELVAKALKAVWAVLKKNRCKRAWAKFEVGTGGMVHAHVMVYGPWLGRELLAKLRATAAAVTGATQYNIKRASKKAIVEACKYVTKGLASDHPKARQTHPLLAAMVDVALRGARIVREYGNWDGMGFTPPAPPKPWVCPHCGSHDHHFVYVTPEQLAAVRKREKDP